jgi:deazaflavin-dependent oxidoreductase (nitroreductase family)
MHLQERLGLRYSSPNLLQRGIQWLAGTAPVAWVSQRALHHVDRVLFRLSDGRTTLSTLLAGVPVVLVTTTGRRSGLERTTPLLGIPVGEHVALVGSNFGQSPTPAWVHNLEADPSARVEYRGTTVDVVARAATDDEADLAFERAAAVYPGYASYRERAAHRTIRVFVLTPRD